MRFLPSLLVGLALLATPAFADGEGVCPPQPIHQYVGSDPLAGTSWGPGLVVALTDPNLLDCDGDGVALDFDGDYDLGTGGGAFGWGPWANDASCKNDFNVHGPYVTATDVVFQDVAMWIGEVDQDGPIRGVHPLTGETYCITDGAITPEEDPDDCLVFVVTHGRTCGTGGGDGLFWVFLATGASATPASVEGYGATTGTLVASWEP